MTSHIPDKGDEVSIVPSKGWAEMIRKVFEVDPLLCPRCGGEMKVISFIEDHKVIDRIIVHLKLNLHGRTASSLSSCPAGTHDGC